MHILGRGPERRTFLREMECVWLCGSCSLAGGRLGHGEAMSVGLECTVTLS